MRTSVPGRTKVASLAPSSNTGRTRMSRPRRNVSSSANSADSCEQISAVNLRGTGSREEIKQSEDSSATRMRRDFTASDFSPTDGPSGTLRRGAGRWGGRCCGSPRTGCRYRAGAGSGRGWRCGSHACTARRRATARVAWRLRAARKSRRGREWVSDESRRKAEIERQGGAEYTERSRHAKGEMEKRGIEADVV